MHRGGGSAAGALVLTLALAGCGGHNERSAPPGPRDGGHESGSASSSGGSGILDFDGSMGLGGVPPSACGRGPKTTISGKVYDPANVNPLYNVAVYVPIYTPQAAPQGVSCPNTCFPDIPRMQSARTDAAGHFSIPDAPDGTNVPLVVQTGKWRMDYTLAKVTACQDNPQPDHSVRLPRNHTEGDLPNIAISTGGDDSLECLPLRMGIDPGEYVGGADGPGRIHVFTGYKGAATQGGTSPDSSSRLWDSDKDIEQFDDVLLSCEGQETASMNQQVMLDYVQCGGRVYASHYQYAWFNTGPIATTSSAPLASWTAGAQLVPNLAGNVVTTLPGGQPFLEGIALKAWLGTVGALIGGQLPLLDAFHNVNLGAANTQSVAWVSSDNVLTLLGYAPYFSVQIISGNAIGGRMLYSDLHVSRGPGAGSDPDYPGLTTGGIVPDGCSMHPLTPQEKVIEFMLFDLPVCIYP